MYDVAGSLATVRLGNNNLAGTLPSTIGYLERPSFLSLVTGSALLWFDVALGNITNSFLASIDLSGNFITGTLPPSFALLNHTLWLELNGNSFLLAQAPIPPYLNNFNPYGLYEFNAKESGLCGAIPFAVLDSNFVPVYLPTDGPLPACPPSPPPPLPTCQNGFMCAPPPQNDPAVCCALADLYYATGGPNTSPSGGWIQTAGWFEAARGCPNGPASCDYCGFWANPSPQYTTQSIIGCGTTYTGAGTGKDITNLDLSNNNLVGTLPNSVKQIFATSASAWTSPTCYSPDFACGLHLTNNQLTGTIPASLGSLSRIGQVALNNNALTGTLPSALSGLTSLKILALSHNSLQGTMPVALNSLLNVSHLYLQASGLCGPDTIPANGYTPDDGLLPACPSPPPPSPPSPPSPPALPLPPQCKAQF
jgi:Leucine rich repeat